MKIAVRYFTRSGNTEKLAGAIAEAVNETAYDVSVPLGEKVDLLFLGSSVYAGGVDNAVKSFIKDNAENIGKIINFSTAAIAPSTFNQVKMIADECGIPIEVDEFHCRGSFSILHRNRPNATDLANSASFAKNIEKKYKL